MMKWHVAQPTWSGDALARDDVLTLFRTMGMTEEEAAARVFMPSYRRFTLVRHTKGRRREVTLPLMSGYLFVRIDRMDMGHVSRLPHVNRFLSFPGTCQPLTLAQDAEGVCKGLEQLRAACEAGKFDQGKSSAGHGYLKDDRVRITEGPLAGTVARFRDGKCRPGFVRVVLDRLMGRDTTMTVSAEALEAA